MVAGRPVAAGAVAAIDRLDVAKAARRVQVVNRVLVAQQQAHPQHVANVEIDAVVRMRDTVPASQPLTRHTAGTDAGMVARRQVLPLDCLDRCHFVLPLLV